jgi:putative hydroxymethylpyrimidine transport system substrate-binding protein
MLDFTPNAVHAGIYAAVHRGFDRQAGVSLQVEQPAASTDSIKLLLAHRIDFAVLDIHDLAIASAQSHELVAVMALVQRPLAAVIAQPRFANPRQLQGRTVGVAGDPSDEAVLDSVLAGAHADPRGVHRVDIGFEAVPSLLSGRVAAATAFWDVEGIELERERPGMHEFRVDEYGAPPYPELVLCTTRAELRRRPALVAAVVRALVRGYDAVLADPSRGIDDMLAEVPGLDRRALAEQLAALRPAFTRPGQRFGVLDMPVLRAWAAWEARFGIVSRAPDVGAIFDPAVAGRATAVGSSAASGARAPGGARRGSRVG